MANVKKTDAQRALGGIIRAEAQRLEREGEAVVPAFVKEVAAAVRGELPKGEPLHVDDVVDRAMAEAMSVWMRFNPPGTRDALYLSKDEIAAIRHVNEGLGRLTELAYETVRKARTGPLPEPLSEGAALSKARDGLLTYLRDERVHQADWQRYFPATWEAALEAGIVDKVMAFGDPARSPVEVHVEEASFLFVGRGPYDLYTEVEVNKMDGALVRAYVEID